MQDIVSATASYEAWVSQQIALYQPDLDAKHQEMASNPFAFFRATFYRWAELWNLHCADLAKLHRVEGVGDLHVQNFGTWRDREGRLVWGVNDFDEAGICAFPNDLVRIAVSVRLASKGAPGLGLSFSQAVREIWRGYRKGASTTSGQPFVLEKTNAWLLRLTRAALKEPKVFWDHWLQDRTEPASSETDLPAEAAARLRSHFPKGAQVQLRVTKTGARPKGLGSLGHRRIFAFAEWQGGPIAREAKSCAASALLWAKGKAPGPLHIMDFLGSPARPTSPHVQLTGDWLIRPILSETGRIEISELQELAPENLEAIDQRRLFRAMGFETASVHLLYSQPDGLRKAVAELSASELESAAKKMVEGTLADFKAWRKHWKSLHG